ncbi:hypothetical protein BP6252_07508 [Coleophoma cylindrospora]|uniref:BZIP domain-containing protein n=1 Tax=Coleophoma cylindrospora TaxID=1849047 RepID=A0A3D8RAA0_9HELO|nr:hypothetical protein BP6252_07508 [Coleophoma cylindrospora]
MIFNGRSIPNLSQYTATLNQVVPPDDRVNDELEFCSQFFDFNLGQDVDLQPTFDGSLVQAVAEAAFDMKSWNFKSGNDSIPEFDFFANTLQQDLSDKLDPPHNPNQINNPNSLKRSITASDLESPSFSGTEQLADMLYLNDELEKAIRGAAFIQNKRWRNKAASSRFRTKQKQYMEQLDRFTKEMRDKEAILERRLEELESENEWLKRLIPEGMDNDGDVIASYKKDDDTIAGNNSASKDDNATQVISILFSAPIEHLDLFDEMESQPLVLQ